MTWQRIDVNHNPEGRPWVRIGCSKRAAGYGQIKLTISPTFARHLGIEPGDKLELYRGVGGHAGWISLVKGSEGFTVTDYRQGHGTLSIRFSLRFLGVDGSHATTKIDGESVVLGEQRFKGGIVDPWLYVELPPWARGEL